MAASFALEYELAYQAGGVSRHEDRDLLIAQRLRTELGGTLDLADHQPPDTDLDGELVY